MRERDFPRELAYAALCCRWRRTPELDERLRTQAASLDWPLFLRIAARHRVEGLAWRNLKQAGVDMPDDAAASLQAAADPIARANLTAAGECARIGQAFANAQLDLLFVKGLSLAGLAYGSILPKAAADIDVLVAKGDVARAAALLQADGYELIVPKWRAEPDAIVRWHRISKESVWRQPQRGVTVELHTSLSDHPLLLGGVGMESPRQDVRIADNLVLPTLATEELFAYLTVHGASSAWFRLKWLADLAALIEGLAPDEIAGLYHHSQELDAARAADLALLLLHDLFETPVPAALLEALRSRRANRWLLAAARRSLAGRAAATELDQLPFGTAWIHLAQFALRPGARYKLGELWRQGALLLAQHRRL